MPTNPAPRDCRAGAVAVPAARQRQADQAGLDGLRPPLLQARTSRRIAQHGFGAKASLGRPVRSVAGLFAAIGPSLMRGVCEFAQQLGETIMVRNGCN